RRHTRSTRDWSSDVCSSDLLRCDEPHFRSKLHALLSNIPEAFGQGSIKEDDRLSVHHAILGPTKREDIDANISSECFQVNFKTRSEERRVGKENKYEWRRYE